MLLNVSTRQQVLQGHLTTIIKMPTNYHCCHGNLVNTACQYRLRRASGLVQYNLSLDNCCGRLQKDGPQCLHEQTGLIFLDWSEMAESGPLYFSRDVGGALLLGLFIGKKNCCNTLHYWYLCHDTYFDILGHECLTVFDHVDTVWHWLTQV